MRVAQGMRVVRLARGECCACSAWCRLRFGCVERGARERRGRRRAREEKGEEGERKGERERVRE